MRQNPSRISDLQSYTISQNINISTREFDINYNGYKALNPNSENKSLVLSGVKADANRVLFWLSSKRDDYVRSYLKGGVLYDLLGQVANDSNLDYWREEIVRRFNEEFSGEMTMLFIELNINKKTKTLIINMIVKDNFNDVTFPVNTEAAL